MDSLQRAKKHDVLSQATNILGKRPQDRFDLPEDEDERSDVDETNSRARRLRRKIQKTSALFPELHDLPSVSLNCDQEPVTRFEHRLYEQQVVNQGRGGRKGITRNQPQQCATRTMTRSRSQQRILKNPPDSHLNTAPKGHQSMAGPSGTLKHGIGGYTAYANLRYDDIAVNPKTSSARDDTSPSNTGELVGGPVEVTPSLRPALARNYQKDRLNQNRYSCKDCSSVFTRKANLHRHTHNRHGRIHDRTTSDWANVSSSSSSEKSSKRESYEGTSTKSNGTRHYFPLPSSRTFYTPGAGANTALMHRTSEAQQQETLHQNLKQQLQEQVGMYRPTSTGHHPRAQATMGQKLSTQRYQQMQQQQERQAGHPPAKGSDILIDTDQLFMDKDQLLVNTDLLFMDTDQLFKDIDRRSLSWDNEISPNKRDDGTRRLKTDLHNPSSNFSAIGHYTISQDNTDGEEARKSLLLAKFGTRCAKNRDAQEFGKQKTWRKGRV